MGDRTQFNTRERALSTDANDLQTVATRMLGDFLTSMNGSRFFGPSVPIFFRSWSKGLALAPDGGSGALLSPGVLLQESATWPAAPSSLEGTARLGINRQNLAVPLPSPAGDTYYLLEARVVDVVSLNASRDVFDPGSGNFIPTAVDKQVQRRIETQLVVGTAADLPAPSADPWVPLYGILIPAGGFAPLDPNAVVDLRQEWADGQASNEFPFAFGDGFDVHARFATANSYHTPVLGNLLGTCDIRGFGGSFAYELLSRSALAFIAPAEEPGFALAADTMVHYYLCGVNSGSFAVAPREQSVGLGADTLTQGILLASLLAPDPFSRTNAFTLTLPPPWTNWNAGSVAPGTALYVGGAMVDTLGTSLVPMEQASNGTAQLMTFPFDTNAVGLRALNFASGAFAPVALPMSLVGKVPDSVRLVQLQLQGANAGGLPIKVDIRNPGGGAGTVIRRWALAAASVHEEITFWLPVQFPNGVNFGRVLEVDLAGGAGGVVNLEIQIIGWMT